MKRLSLPLLLLALSICGLVISAVDAFFAGTPRPDWESVPDFSERFSLLRENEQGYREFIHHQTGIVFVEIPGGEYFRGSGEGDELARINEMPPHRVRVSPFLIARHEVTLAQWHRVIDPDPAELRRRRPTDLPRVEVSWFDARRFLDRAGLQLPTETQWEYACRGPAGREGSAPDLGEQAWTRDNSHRDLAGLVESRFQLHRVARKKPNRFGLHDLLGNAWEWCEDSYVEGFYQLPESALPDPICRTDGGPKVIRGGSYLHGETHCRPTYRRGLAPDQKTGNVGFRPVFSHPSSGRSS